MRRRVLPWESVVSRSLPKKPELRDARWKLCWNLLETERDTPRGVAAESDLCHRRWHEKRCLCAGVGTIQAVAMAGGQCREHLSRRIRQDAFCDRNGKAAYAARRAGGCTFARIQAKCGRYGESRSHWRCGPVWG